MAYLKKWMGKVMNENRPTLKSKKRKYISNDGLFLQALLTTIVLILGLMSILIKEMVIPMELSLSALMFVMAYNNQTSYAKEKMTGIYILAGVLILLTLLLEMIF